MPKPSVPRILPPDMMAEEMLILDPLPEIRWSDVLDVVLVAVFLWATFGWLRHTRSRLALTGVLLLSGVYLAARQLDLQLTVWLLQGFFAVLVFVLVVVFQEDLRRIFEQIAVWGLQIGRAHV